MEQYNKKYIALKTIGCKLNFAETSTIARDFTKRGFEIVEFNSKADIYVINTCTVTANADKDCRKSVRQAIRNNPDAYVAMVGCYSQLHPEEASSILGVNTVLGNDEKYKIYQYYKEYNDSSGEIEYHSKVDHLNDFYASYSAEERTRAFLKVQDGCDYECTYCTIPLARGKSRSNSIAGTVLQAQKISATKTREIVLTGVNIGDFGKSSNESFIDLIKALDKLEGLERIRISSIEPNLLTKEIIEFIARSRLFVSHFHIPLQSGSNKVLKDMHRRYQSELYSAGVEMIKGVIPDCCIGVDVIVGFPTETAKDFQRTYDLLSELDISYLHIFSYSQRDNTKALEFENIVNQELKVERSKMLHELSDRKRFAFQEEFISHRKSVLFESQNNGAAQGYTANYIKVIVESSEDLVNKIKTVTLVENKTAHMVGKL